MRKIGERFIICLTNFDRVTRYLTTCQPVDGLMKCVQVHCPKVQGAQATPEGSAEDRQPQAYGNERMLMSPPGKGSLIVGFFPL